MHETGVLAKESFERRSIAGHDRIGCLLEGGYRCRATECLEMVRQPGPALEAVRARDDELRLRERASGGETLAREGSDLIGVSLGAAERGARSPSVWSSSRSRTQRAAHA